MAKSEKIGALWIHEKKGLKYLAGTVEVGGEKIQVFVFKNKYKKNDKHPDYIIYLPYEDSSASAAPADDEDDMPF